MNIQTFLTGFLKFLNDTVVPAILAFAFFVFVWNAFRYFILGGANEESQQKARSLATWSVAAFVIILSLWGIVNLVVGGSGLGLKSGIVPDYMCKRLFGTCATPGAVEDPYVISQRFDTQERDVGDRDTGSESGVGGGAVIPNNTIQVRDISSEIVDDQDNASDRAQWNKRISDLTDTQLAELPDAVKNYEGGSLEIVSIGEDSDGRNQVELYDKETGGFYTLNKGGADDSIQITMNVANQTAEFIATPNKSNGFVFYRNGGASLNLSQNIQESIIDGEIEKVLEAFFTFPTSAG